MSIVKQANFWFDNVCDLPAETLKKEMEISDYLVEGLDEFINLLKSMYKEYHMYEVSTAESIRTKIGIMADDLENYHNLTDTAACLYGITSVSELCTEGENSFLKVDKAIFKANFKKSVIFFFDILEKYSFYFKYFKAEKEVTTYKQCDRFEVFYDNKNSLIAAIKYLAEHSPEANVKDDYTVTKTLFMLADFKSIILKNSTKRKEMDPLRTEILKTVGKYSELWFEIVKFFRDQNELGTDISMNTYVFPNWTVKFTRNKRTICTFIIRVDELHIRLPLSYSVAKDVIKSRDKLPKSVSDSLNNFGCVHCGKCANQSNIELFEGINLCKLNYINFVTEDSRCIQTSISSKEEVESIYNIIKSCIA